MDASGFLGALSIGLGATLVLDLWNLFLRLAFGIPSLDNRLLGRWLLHMPDGVIRHARIAAAPAKAGERVVGWLAHYAIGALLAIGFVGLVSDTWLARPTPMPALLFGLAGLEGHPGAGRQADGDRQREGPGAKRSRTLPDGRQRDELRERKENGEYDGKVDHRRVNGRR